MFFSTKVGSGYTMNELHELDQLLRPHWKPFDTKNPPESIILAPGFKVSKQPCAAFRYSCLSLAHNSF